MYAISKDFNPADRIPALFETPKLSLSDTLFLRFGITAYEAAPHILVVDLSHWNGNVAFKLLRESGVVAVILKCSEGAEGTYYEYKDVRFEMFWRQALDEGFPVMLYHFFRGEKGAAEFSWFMKCADAFLNDTRILGKTAAYLDCEWRPSALSLSAYSNRAFGFADLTTGEGMENGIYSSPGLVPQLFAAPALDPRWDTVNQWNAHWSPGEDTLPPGWSEAKRNARQRGIYDTHWWVEKVLGAGKVDINHMFYANEAALRQWLGQGVVVASPSESPSPSASPSPSLPPSDCCEEHALRLDTIEAGQQVLTEVQISHALSLESHSTKLDAITEDVGEINVHIGQLYDRVLSLEEKAVQIDANTELILNHDHRIAIVEANFLSLYQKYEKVRKAFLDNE